MQHHGMEQGPKKVPDCSSDGKESQLIMSKLDYVLFKCLHSVRMKLRELLAALAVFFREQPQGLQRITELLHC
jgi:hypothetical protein